MSDVRIDGVRYIPHPENRIKWESIAQALKYLRGLKRLSLGEAATKVGISKTYLWELEAGEADTPSFNIIATLADLYGVSLDAFPRKPKEPKP